MDDKEILLFVKLFLHNRNWKIDNLANFHKLKKTGVDFCNFYTCNKILK